VKEAKQPGKESWINRLLFDKPIVKFIFFTIIYIILITVLEDRAETNSIRIPLTIIHIVLATYLIALMIYVIRHSMKRLVSSKDSKELIW